MKLSGNVSFVTGAAKRLGKAIALALAREGSSVAINYRTSREEAQETVQEIQDLGMKAIALQGDVSEKKSINSMAETIRGELGPVDILVNNASIYEETPWPEISEEDWVRHLDINLKGPFLLAQAFAPSMVQRGHGKIINLVDPAGERPFKGYLPYSVSEAGLISLTKALARELAPDVTVNGVGPGPILPPPGGLTTKQRIAIENATPLGRFGKPEDIAKAVLFFATEADYATGTILYIDGGRLVA